MLNNGQILQGNYRIIGSLGHGGMGSVYLAEHTRLAGRRFAIKENIPEANADPQTLADLRTQFYVEAKTLAALDHPNLPKVSDYFAMGDNEYLVMDFVEGENLQQVFDRHVQQFRVPLPEKAVLGWTDQVLDALEYLHRQRPSPIVHRDIKPANIILTPTGIVKLVDFGLVKLLDQTGQNTAAALRGMGTPAYTALEQYPGNESHTDARTDLYGLGATLYHLLTGMPPANVRDRLLNPKALEKPRRLNTKLSAHTETAILKAIEVHPDQRFQTASQMRVALGGKAAQAAGVSAPARQRRWVVPIALLALVAVLAAAGAWRMGIFPPAPGGSPTSGPVATIVAATSVANASVVLPPTEAPTSPATVALPATDSPAALTPTAAPAETDTPLPTNTSEPTSTPAPTTPPPPTATPVPRAVASGETNLRSGPGTVYPVVDTLPAGGEAKITGKNQDETWWQLQRDDGASVWIIANRVEATGSVDTVEVVAAPPTPTPSPIPTPSRPGLVADFERGSAWPMGVQKYGQFAPSQDQARVGLSSARLSYDFPAVADNYVVFLAPSPIAINGPSGPPTGLVAWVNGNGSGHYLIAWVQDKDGEVRAYTFGQVSHIGWQIMTAWFDDTKDWPNGHISGADNGSLDYPVRLFALVLDGVRDGVASNGIIHIDDLMATQEAIPVSAPVPPPPAPPTPAPATRAATLPGTPGTGQATKMGSLRAFGLLMGVWLVADRPRVGRRRKVRR